MKPGKLSGYGAGAVFLLAAASAPHVHAWESPGGELSLRGYVKTSQTATFRDDLDTLIGGQRLQPRLNLLWKPAPAWQATFEVRQVAVIGEAVRLSPGLGDELSRDPGAVDASWTPVSEAGAVWNLAVDRAWVEWRGNLWQTRVGRQRVNWGMALAWNPNDLFNAYDVSAVDDEEKPGSDALRLQFFPGDWSVEAAAKRDADAKSVAGLRLSRTFASTDCQLLSAWHRGDVALGGGFAGPLGQAGVKGEFTGFLPVEENSPWAYAATVSLDYAFPNGTYASASALYGRMEGDEEADPAGTPLSASGGWIGLGSGALSAKRLMPVDFALAVQAQRAFTLLLSGSVLVMVLPEVHGWLFSPAINYGLAQDWDAQLAAQSAWSLGTGTGAESLLQSFLLRFRWSF